MQKRITIFDTVRGFTMISMAGFHACYDLAYLYGWDMPWFTQTVFQDIWRASISWVFLFIAGWMCTLSRNNIKRAAKYALAALVVWLATTLVSVDDCVSLNEVVLGRYTFVFLNYFTSMVVIIILYLGFVLCRKATFDVPDIMLGLGLSFLVFSTITGIQMPLFFKMGYTKAKLWSVIPFAVVMLLVVLPSFVSALSGILDFAQSHKELFAFACILTSCIIQFVSYHIAVIFYRKQR